MTWLPQVGCLRMMTEEKENNIWILPTSHEENGTIWAK